MKSRKVKWYTERLMRRAAVPLHIFRAGVAAIHMPQGGRLELVAYSEKFGITRDGRAFTKEFAKAVADINSSRLYLVAGVTRDGALEVVRSMQARFDSMPQPSIRTIRITGAVQ